MGDRFDLFEFYRFVLATLAGVYSLIRLIMIIWWWQRDADALLGSAMARRYVTVLLFRLRFRRFVYEAVVLGGLTWVLLLLIRSHWQ